MKKFSGIFTALVTPFKDGNIDTDSLNKIITAQMRAKIDGVVIAGSTGEGTNLTIEEYEYLVFTVAEKIYQYKSSEYNPKIIATVASNSMHYALKLLDIASKAAIDGIMATTPSYLKPPQEGLIEYFSQISDNTDLDIILYTVPSRTNVDFTDDTICELAKKSNIVGLKDSSSDILRTLRLSDKLGEDFSILSGNDIDALAFYVYGASGSVSVISNLYPEVIKTLFQLCKDNKWQEALKLQKILLPLHEILLEETNPIVIKHLLSSVKKLCSDDVRLPLVKKSTDNNKILKSIGLLKEYYKDNNISNYSYDE